MRRILRVWGQMPGPGRACGVPGALRMVQSVGWCGLSVQGSEDLVFRAQGLGFSLGVDAWSWA